MEADTSVTRRRSLAFLLLFAAVGVTFWYLQVREVQHRAARVADNTAVNSLTAEDKARLQASSATPPPDATSRSPIALSSPQTLRGAVVVHDSAGREHTTEDGEITLIAWNDDSGISVATKITAGTFEASLPPCKEFSVDRLRLGGRPAAVGFERESLPTNGVLALRARWPTLTTLKVVDDRYDRELSRVVVLHATRSAGVGLMHPGPDANISPVVDDAPSPIVLPDRVGLANYWVCSPGYAWRRLSVDHLAGGMQVVRLATGGAIEVQLTNYHADSQVRVRVRRSEASERSDSELVRSDGLGRPDAEASPLATGRVVIDALESGTYHVSVEIGSWLRRVVVLGRANTVVEAGTTAMVEIRLADPPPLLQRVPLRGVLELSPEWGNLEPEVRLTAFDDESALGGPAEPIGPLKCRRVEEELRWVAGDVLPGRYVFAIDDPPFSTMLVVDSRGAHDAHVVVPPPSNVVVHTIEAGTRKPVQVDEIQLERLTPPVQVGAIRGSVTPVNSDESGVARARVPAGTFRVAIESSEYVLSVADNAAGQWEVRPGQDEIVVIVTRPSGVRVEFPDLDVERSEIFRFKIEMRALGHGGAARLWRCGPTSQTFVVTEAGSYEVAILPPDRFNRVAPLVVEVQAGQITEQAVDLDLRK